jgi:hypothetical protein
MSRKGLNMRSRISYYHSEVSQSPSGIVAFGSYPKILIMGINEMKNAESLSLSLCTLGCVCYMFCRNVIIFLKATVFSLLFS